MLQSGSFTSGMYEFENLFVVPEEIVVLHASPSLCVDSQVLGTF